GGGDADDLRQRNPIAFGNGQHRPEQELNALPARTDDNRVVLGDELVRGQQRRRTGEFLGHISGSSAFLACGRLGALRGGSFMLQSLLKGRGALVRTNLAGLT